MVDVRGRSPVEYLVVFLVLAAVVWFVVVPFVATFGHETIPTLPDSEFDFKETSEGVEISVEPYPEQEDFDRVGSMYRVEVVSVRSVFGFEFERSSTAVEPGSDRWSDTEVERRVSGSDNVLLTNESSVVLGWDEVSSGDVIRVKVVNDAATGVRGLRRGYLPSEGVDTLAEYRIEGR